MISNEQKKPRARRPVSSCLTRHQEAFRAVAAGFSFRPALVIPGCLVCTNLLDDVECLRQISALTTNRSPADHRARRAQPSTPGCSPKKPRPGGIQADGVAPGTRHDPIHHPRTRRRLNGRAGAKMSTFGALRSPIHAFFGRSAGPRGNGCSRSRRPADRRLPSHA